MKKNFKSYAIIWIILFTVFNAVVFILRFTMAELFPFDASFWIAWSFVTFAFIGNLACSYFSFKAKNAKKMFYNLPIITVSWSALIIMLVVGCALMSIPKCPAWITSIICILILAFNAIAVIKAKWAGDAVSTIDEKIKMQTSFIKNITVDAENLIGHAKNDTVRGECEKIYEIFRYSDPMSTLELSSIEKTISVKMSEFTAAVDCDDIEKASELANEIIILAKERNNKCKSLK